MNSRSLEPSITMLREVLDGGTYEQVGRNHSLTHTTVERRVKSLCLFLHKTVGIEGLSDQGVIFVRRLRHHRDAVLRALEDFESKPSVVAQKATPRVFAPQEILQAAGRVRAYSNQPLRDVALFLILFATGARPLEIARLKVRDYLTEDGSVRRHSEMPAETAINGMARPLYFCSTRLDEALLPYLQQRADTASPADPARYLGLAPDRPLFLDIHGQGFEIMTYGEPGHTRHLCRSILEAYRRIFRYAQLPGSSPKQAQTTIAYRLYARGADDRQVGLVLGIVHTLSVRNRFPKEQPTLRQIVEELI